ncbi:MAG: cytochrome C oxidase subunit IV family protein [Gemmataceae bacterium]|nr:cytochrome C oxidase subunit IV family protein [Gemmataceae bacterium]
MAHKPIAPATYAAVYATLLGLTALTVAIANGLSLGAWEVPVALGIAAVKTVLVGLVFMHLMHSSKLTWLVIGAGVLFFAVMIGITLADYATRGWLPEG